MGYLIRSFFTWKASSTLISSRGSSVLGGLTLPSLQLFQPSLGNAGKLWSLGEDLEAAQHMDDRGEDDLMVSVVQTIKGMWTRARYVGN